jgi:ATP-dependent Lon protease
LRGRVLEIGGVKEKVLAAYRAGLREVILPSSNQKDLREVPDEVRANMAFTFASTLDEVLRHALLAPAEADGAAPAAAKPEIPVAPTPVVDTPRIVAHPG